MTDVTALADLIDGRPIREVEPGLFSVLPADTLGQRYDHRARAYDRLIGSRLYNRLFWGSSPANYQTFARQAVGSSAEGWLLDAGCGTLLLTAQAYAEAPNRGVVALDKSLGMLRRAKERLVEVGGGVADRVVFLQADLLDLPFRAGSFETVLSMGMLHLFDEMGPLLASLERSLSSEGRLFLASLVESGRIGDHYLRFLHRTGEVASPRTAVQLETELRECLTHDIEYSVMGNMAYAMSKP